MASQWTLEGKVALITGGTRGIGWGTARLFAQHQATVLLNGVADSRYLQSRVREIKDEFGVGCEGFQFDVSDPGAVKECYSTIYKRYKRLDIVVNNAGVMFDSLLSMASTENIDRTFDVNVKGIIYNMQYASRLMARNRSGSIVNLASIIGRVGNSGQVVYGGSKAAVIGLTMSGAKELAEHNIRVNAVAPGFIDTDMTKAMPPDKFEERIGSIKMGRIGTAEDVARAIYFFASDLSKYVTGQVLGVDGGMLI
jgi:3-oxoacyl-[acyl-carrier protein] reductase